MSRREHCPTEPAEKLWELLRRNPCFAKAVARLQNLQRRVQSGDAEAARRAHDVGQRMLWHLKKRNLFAAEALRWLVPLPLFIWEQIAPPPGFDPRQKCCPHFTVRLGWGITPDHKDEKWRWFKAVADRDAWHSANLSGWPARWGPTIGTVTTRSRRLAQACQDGIAEWRAYFEHRQFTLDTFWKAAPPGFQSAFRNRWADLPGGNHTPYETEFFHGWSLGSAITRACDVVKAANGCIQKLVHDLDQVSVGKPETVCPPTRTKEGNSMRQMPQFALHLDQHDFARVREFEKLAQYRIFAIPQLLLRSDVKPIFDKLAAAVAAELPDHHELLGTPEFWSDFQAVDLIERKEQVDTSEAIRRYIRRTKAQPRIAREIQHRGPEVQRRIHRWFRYGFLLPRPCESRIDLDEWRDVGKLLNDTLRGVDAAYRTTVKARVAYMRTLSGATFPRFDLHTLLSRAPTKRRRSK